MPGALDLHRKSGLKKKGGGGGLRGCKGSNFTFTLILRSCYSLFIRCACECVPGSEFSCSVSQRRTGLILLRLGR